MGDSQLCRLAARRLTHQHRGAPFALLITVLALPAAAEIQEYQVRRLLLMRTSCEVTVIRMDERAGRARSYHADCVNAGFYPDGVEIDCADREDERSCVVLTTARSFDHLRLLQPSDP